MSDPDRLQQAWQSQPAGMLGGDPDTLLKFARWSGGSPFWGKFS